MLADVRQRLLDGPVDRALGRRFEVRERLDIQGRFDAGDPLVGWGGAWLAAKFTPVAEYDAAWKAWDQQWSDALAGEDSANWTEEQWKTWDAEHASLYDKMPDDSGTVSGFDWTSLVGASPHSGTQFELAGNIGVAIAVVVGLVSLLGMGGKAGARLRWWFGPLIAVGSMSLTVYVGHIAAVWFLVDHASNGIGYETGWKMLGLFVAGAMVFALVWKRFLKRGPLEWAMWAAATPAKFVK